MDKVIHGARSERNRQYTYAEASVDMGQRSKNKWFGGYRVRGNPRRINGGNLSSRISVGWSGSLWNWNSPRNRQKREDLKALLIRKAARNALTFHVVLVLFIATWIWIFISVAFFGGKLH